MNGDMTITAVFDKGAAVQNVWSVTIVTNDGTTRVKVPDGESLGDRAADGRRHHRLGG